MSPGLELRFGLAAPHLAREQLLSANSVLRHQHDQTRAIAAQVQAGEADNLDLLAGRLGVATAELASVEAAAKLDEAISLLEDVLQRPIGSPALPDLTTPVQPLPERSGRYFRSSK